MRRSWIILALAWSFVASCTCSKKETEAVTLHGPVEATVVKVDRKGVGIGAIGGGHVGILVPERTKESTCEIRITKPKTLTYVVRGPCDASYRLASDPEGKRLAYGASGETWSIIYFGGKDRSFDGFVHPPEGPIDWAKVPPLRETYPDQMRAMIGVEPKTDALLDEILEASGPDVLADVLVATKSEPAEPDREAIAQRTRAIWGRGLARLSGAESAKVTTELEPLLATLADVPGPLVESTLRAALYLDVDRPDLVDRWTVALEKRIKAMKRVPAEVETLASHVVFPLSLLLSRKSRRDPARAAVIACDLLGKIARPKNDRSPDPTMDAFRAIASAAAIRGTGRCPALDAMMKVAEDQHYGPLCRDPAWFCPRVEPPPPSTTKDKTPVDPLAHADHPCTPAEARAEIDRAMTLPLDDARRLWLPLSDVLVPYLLARGIDPTRQRAVARQMYRRDTPAGATRCDMLLPDAGDVRCDPGESVASVMSTCKGTATTEGSSIVVHFDDGQKRMWFTRGDDDTRDR